MLLAGALCLSCSGDEDPTDVLPSTPPVDTASPEQPTHEIDSLEVWCTGHDGLKIYGKLFRPKGNDESLPAVILSHSHSLTHEAMRGYARLIAAQGFTAYCFDFCGGSSSSRSEGSTDAMTLFTEKDDLQGVLGEISGRSDVDASQVFLLGSSLGGVASALVAEDNPSKVAGLILFYPAFNIGELISQLTGSMGSWGGMGGMDFTNNAFVQALTDYDIYAHIGTYPSDVLILHGTNDVIVPQASVEKAAARYAHCKVQMIEDANHGFNADNLGSMGAMMGGTANYDEVVMPFVYNYLSEHTAAEK
ncbi:MAG: alpha/beta hydrolase family protein [Alloprevotella sp.]